jgi:hypothetical protein
MSTILLLYDTTEKDLARDFRDLLAEFDLSVETIPLSSDLGKTLQSKEEHYLERADGFIFLVTPGSERMGKLFRSPSVADEMGQVKQKFKGTPEKVIYLVDKNCNIQAIDQKAYISFDRRDIRTVLEAITLLIRNLKHSGLFKKKEIEQRETPGIDIAEYSKSINPTLKKICYDLSDMPNGFISVIDFDKLLKNNYGMDDRNINFTKGDLQKVGLIFYISPNLEKMPYFYGGWRLSNLGFELVRFEIEKSREEENQFKGKLIEALVKGQYKALTALPKALEELYKK